MAKPSNVPTWATSGTRATPSTAEKAAGWVFRQIIPFDFVNWFWGLTGDWLTHINRLPASNRSSTIEFRDTRRFGWVSLGTTGVDEVSIDRLSSGLTTIAYVSGSGAIAAAIIGMEVKKLTGAEILVSAVTGTVTVNVNTVDASGAICGTYTAAVSGTGTVALSASGTPAEPDQPSSILIEVIPSSGESITFSQINIDVEAV